MQWRNHSREEGEGAGGWGCGRGERDAEREALNGSQDERTFYLDQNAGWQREDKDVCSVFDN